MTSQPLLRIYLRISGYSFFLSLKGTSWIIFFSATTSYKWSWWVLVMNLSIFQDSEVVATTFPFLFLEDSPTLGAIICNRKQKTMLFPHQT